jgi:hypothetical protein
MQCKKLPTWHAPLRWVQSLVHRFVDNFPLQVTKEALQTFFHRLDEDVDVIFVALIIFKWSDCWLVLRM